MVQDVEGDKFVVWARSMPRGRRFISSSTKTGGATFHGAAYLVARNAVLNSNDWYDNYLRQSRPNEQYFYPGGNFGGPLLLPFTSFNHNRDKLFFFAGYEYYNQIFEADQQAISAWVPTAAERQGDFSAASLDAELCGARPDGNPNPNAIQPMCYVDSFLPNGTAVANNNANAYINGAGAALVNWFPAPNADPFTNPFGYNYIKQLQQNQNGSVFRATLQYNINATNNLFLVYGLQRENDQDPVDVNNQFPTGSVPYPGAITTGDVSNIVSARYTRFFGSSVTNQFIAAMSFVSLPGKMGNPTAVDRFDIAGNGGDGFNYLGMYKNNGDYSVPAIGNGGSNGYPNLNMPGGFYQNQIHTKQVDPILQDNVSWQLKNHFLEFGVYGEQGTYNGTAFVRYPQGEYTFNPGNSYFEYSPTNQAPYNGCVNPNPPGNLRASGAAYLGSCYNPTAMMYEGYADSFTQTNFTPLVDMRYTTMAGFANDTLKVHSLTLILRLRALSISGPGRTAITTAWRRSPTAFTPRSAAATRATAPAPASRASRGLRKRPAYRTPSTPQHRSISLPAWELPGISLARARPYCAAAGAFTATRSSSIPTPLRRPRHRDTRLRTCRER